MYKKRIIRQDKSGVASVIVALLLFGLIITSLVTIQTIYVPRWVEQDEGNHMHDIADSFAQLKYAIDIQTNSKNKIPISTPISLGIEVNSFMTQTRSYGTLDIVSDDITIVFSNATDDLPYSLGSIKYSSTNNYYVNQKYILEAGGVVINQSTGNIMSSDPSRILNNGDFEIGFTFVNILNHGGKTSISGYGTYSIQTNYSDTTYENMTDVDSIVVTTDHPNAWHIFLDNTFEDLGLTDGDDFTTDTASNSVTVNIDGATVVDISIDIVKIFSQISPGRVN